MRVALYRGMPWYVGGSLQYENTLLDAFADIGPRRDDELFVETGSEDNLRSMAQVGGLNYRGLPVQFIETPYTQPPHQKFLNIKIPEPTDLPDPDSFHINKHLVKYFHDRKVDLIFQLLFDSVGFRSLKPFVMPIHDLQHLMQPHFPEVSEYGEVTKREYLYRNACKYATLLIAESEVGKEDILKYYGHLITEDRIRILPPFPPRPTRPPATEAGMAQVKAKYKLPERFFFYPAQFWSHKNHDAIIRALRIARDATGEVLRVVFCGSYTGTHRAHVFENVRQLISQQEIAGQVYYLGFVPDDDMEALYRLSSGLVMPTYFGPSNLPPLEAWQYGCPVITSDIRGIREQTGDAGLLVDPANPEALARAMVTLHRDEALQQQLVARGRARIKAYPWPDYVQRVEQILDEALERVRNGQTPRYPVSV